MLSGLVEGNLLLWVLPQELQESIVLVNGQMEMHTSEEDPRTVHVYCVI